MKFNYYCVIIMGDTKNVLSEIEKISDGTPNVLDAKGIIISTLVSALTINEINEWFKLHNRSFFVFDLRKSGFNITKPEIHDTLYWVNKDDPLGPQPIDPNQDPQFFHWEWAVQKWATEQGY